MSASRASVVSSFTIIKGAMIEETYAAFVAWDFDLTKSENLTRICDENIVGAKSSNWLRDVAKVLNRRFDPDHRDRPLVMLAKAGCSPDIWKPLLLWHITRDEFLFRDFLIHWLYPAFESGIFRVRPNSLYEYLGDIGSRGGTTEHEWSEKTSHRVATGLLKMAADFGLIRGGAIKVFSSYYLPQPSMLYLIHAISQELGSPRKMIDAPDWRMFFMSPAEVEGELFRLHQFHEIRFDVAGSLVQLTLPSENLLDFSEKMMV